MSEIKYGLISKVDAGVLERTIDLMCERFKDDAVFITEIGLYNCETSRGIIQYMRSKGRIPFYTGIDNEKDKPIESPYTIKFIKGNSNEVYNQIEDESQHLIFVDGCHCFAHVVSDFFCYAPKVKKGGFIAFHDTGRHIKPFKDFQHGDEKNPDAFISVRKALTAIGMFEDAGYDEAAIRMGIRYKGGNGFRLIFDEADETDEAGGICGFKKL